MLACVENMQRHAIDQDFDDHASIISDEHVLLLKRFLEARGVRAPDDGSEQ
jgi:hypothetical protein